MKVINRIGGAFLLLVLGIATITGFQSDIGRPIWNSLWDATTAVLSYFSELVSGFTSVAGDGRAAIGWAATGLLALLIVMKKPVSVRAFTILLLVGAAVAFILWDPSILP